MVERTHTSLTYQRVKLTKPIALVYVIDMFDVYGTLDELTLFPHAINQCVCCIYKNG